MEGMLLRGTAAGDWFKPFFEEGLPYAKEQCRLHGDDGSYWTYEISKLQRVLEGLQGE